MSEIADHHMVGHAMPRNGDDLVWSNVGCWLRSCYDCHIITSLYQHFGYS